METVDVAIIGAGISGLSAARLLSKAGFCGYAVYEASDRVGGRTLADADGTDLGGAYVGPTQDRILSIIDELDLKLRKVNTKGKTVQVINGCARLYDGTIPPVSILGLLDLNAAMVSIDELGAEINLSHPHLSGNAEWLDGMTAEELILRYTWLSASRDILRTGIRAILCTEPCQISALYLVWYIAMSGGVKRIFETTDGAQDCKVVGGAGQIAPLLAERYCYSDGMPPKLSLNCPLRCLEYCDDANEFRIMLKFDSGRCVRAKYVILAIAPVQQLRIQYKPALSAPRWQSLQRWPMGCIIKTFVYYDNNFWGSKNLNGSIVADAGIVCVSYDDTKADGSKPCIMGFILSTSALANLSTDDRRRIICVHYAKCFSSSEALKSVAYKEKQWSEEQYVGGCYVGSVGPKVLTTCHRAHCDPFWGEKLEHTSNGSSGRVFVAGTEAAWRMIGYMDGAVESGERCARNVLVELGLLGPDQFDIVSNPPPSVQMPFVEMKISALEKMLPSVGNVLYGSVVLLTVIAVIIAKKRV